MKYVILIAYEPMDWSTVSAQTQQAYFDAHDAFSSYVEQHGEHLASAALADADTATTVRHRDGVRVVTDGPFAETAEQIGGYYEVDLPDLDTAIEASALLPAAYAVEIRPVVQIEGYHDS